MPFHVLRPEILTALSGVSRRGLSRRSLLRGVVLAGLGALTPSLATAATPPAGNSSRQSRDEAARLIPYDKLSADDRSRVQAVVNDTSIFRRMPTQVFPCDPNFYLFLVENPEVVIDVWRVLGMTEVTVTRTAPELFRINDKAGTTGSVEFLHRSYDTHLLLADGAYEGPFFNRKVRGKCVLLLKTGYVRETDGRYYITCRMDAFVSIENVGADLVARTFQPLVTPMADHNFRETANFLSSFNQAAEVNPDGVRNLSDKLNNIQQSQRDQLSTLADSVALRAAEVEAASSRVPLTAERPSTTPRR